MKRLSILLAALVLAGCATYNRDGIEAMNRNDLSGAEQHFMQGVQRGDPNSINNMGVVAQRRGDRAMAVRYFTLAARWGLPLAQQNLAKMGESIPPADLAAQKAHADAANAAQMAATMQMIRAMQPAPPPPPTSLNCTSTRFGNSVQTNCY